MFYNMLENLISKQLLVIVIFVLYIQNFKQIYKENDKGTD